MGSQDGEMATQCGLGNGVGVFADFSFGILYRSFFSNDSFAALYDEGLNSVSIAMKVDQSDF